MPDKLYPLDKEKKQILNVSWKRNFKNLELQLNNRSLGKIENRQELIQGKEFEISHDQRLSVKLVREMYFFTELELLLNGFPVPFSMTHPVKKLNDVFVVIMFIAAISLILGLLSLTTDTGFYKSLGIGFWNIIYAGIFIILGMMMKEKKSMFAMVSMIVLMVLDMIFSFVFMMETGQPVNPALPVIVKLFLTLLLIRGIRAIKEYGTMEERMKALEKEEEEKKRKTPLSRQVTEDHSKFMPGDHSAYMPEGGG
ncbi:MAG: hypothetical protein JW723_14515 [Bacteroidales bacterium]|nr:hypothetical protein [Bacteroidales bacterium]